MAELLLDLELGDEHRELAENIYRSGNQLLTVINDILDFSKVESGRLDIEEVRFSLSIIIRDVKTMLGFAADRKNLDFQSNIAVEIDRDLVVLGDPGRVKQIITNLLTNSIKFTNRGCVKFSVAIETEDADVIEVRFVVEDTGIGIEDDVRRRLFQPFSQGDASTARKFGGTGLGLTICKNLLDLMKGRITLESTLGAGTTATFWIPFKRPHATCDDSDIRINAVPDRLQSETSLSRNSSEYEQPIGTSPGEVAGSRLDGNRTSRRNPSISLSATGSPDDDLPSAERARIHVLVVEDNAINQQIAIKTIKKLGFQVSAAWNGKEALEHLTAAKRGTQRKPDIILMDVQMPVIDGYKCTHLLRHHLPYKTFASDIPIVAMTASAIQGDKEKCKRAGMDDYLAKPVKSKILERMLVHWLSTNGRAGGRRRPAMAAISRPDDGSSVKSSDENCSEASEQCNNADIPVVGLDRDEDVTRVVLSRIKDYASHDDDPTNNLATPRPLHSDKNDTSTGSAGGGYFPGYAVTWPSPSPSPTPSLSSKTQIGMMGLDQMDGHGHAVSDEMDDGVVSPHLDRFKTAELAIQSRDNKLVDAAGGPPAAGGHGYDGGEALTEENVERLEEEEEEKQKGKKRSV